MNFLQKLQQRYTTKKYDPTKKISQKDIETLKEILRITPSSINSQPWQFIFISDNETKAKLAKASMFNEQKILDCDTLIVLNRIDSIALFEQQIQEELPEGAIGFYNQFLKTQPDQQKKIWFEKQVYIALGVLLSACADMGIDSTPMEGFINEEYNSILGLENYHSVLAVTIGHRDNQDPNQLIHKAKSRIHHSKVIKHI